MSEGDWVAVAAIAGVITAVFTAAMAVAIIVTAIYAKQTLVAAKADSRERTRPVIAAFFERELLSQGTILLIIKNFGQTSGNAVSVQFDPPAPTPAQVAALPASDMRKWLFERFSEPVPVWAPGWSTSNVLRAGHDELEPFTVVISYWGADGTPYSDRFPLLPDHVLKETSSSPSKTDSPVKLGQQAVAAIQALVRTIRTRQRRIS